MNDNAPEFLTDLVRISVAENLLVGKIFYQVNVQGQDVGMNRELSYGLLNCHTSLTKDEDIFYWHSQSYPHKNAPFPLNRSTKNNVTIGASLNGICGDSDNASGPMFIIDSRLGHITLSRHLDFEAAKRHILLISAVYAGPQHHLSSNLTISIDVQDINDNTPQFNRSEYSVKILESMPINSQVIKLIKRHDTISLL